MNAIATLAIAICHVDICSRDKLNEKLWKKWCKLITPSGKKRTQNLGFTEDGQYNNAISRNVHNSKLKFLKFGNLAEINEG